VPTRVVETDKLGVAAGLGRRRPLLDHQRSHLQGVRARLDNRLLRRLLARASLSATSAGRSIGTQHLKQIRA